MRTFVLSAIILATSALSASAFEVVTGQGTGNYVAVDGVAYAIPINRICGMSSMKAGAARYDIGRAGNYVTIGGEVSRILCAARSGGGGGGGAGYNGGQSLGQSQDRSGEMNPGETRGPEGTDPATGGGGGFGAISG